MRLLHSGRVRDVYADGDDLVLVASDRVSIYDVVLTPDSSGFWPADRWEPGHPQSSFDKQFVRDWSAPLDWDRTPPGPPVPPEVVAATPRPLRRGLRAPHGLDWA